MTDTHNATDVFDPLKWRSLTSWASLPELRPTTTHQEMNLVWEAFDANMKRVTSAITVPDVAVLMRGLLQKSLDIAQLLVLGKLDWDNSWSENKAQTEQIGVIMREQFAQGISKLDVSNKDEDQKRAATVEMLRQGAYIIGVLQLGKDPAFLSGLEGILYSSLTGTWTAFETLAADLWEAALNAHPDCLANLNGGRAGRIGNEDGKHVLLKDIAKYRWNISSKMGSVLKERYNFSRLDGIRRAYEQAFSKQNQAILKIIGSERFR